MCLNTIDFRRGDAHPDLVFLGACPGQDEWIADPQRPFAGRSGVNLRCLLEVLGNLPNKGHYGLRPDDFLSRNLYDYTLMNSHAEPKWKAEHGRTTPRMSEIKAPENLERLTNQLRLVEARVVVGLGRPIDDAHLLRMARDSGSLRAIRMLAPDNQEISFLITGHPSPQAINCHGNGDPRDWFQESMSVFPQA